MSKKANRRAARRLVATLATVVTAAMMLGLGIGPGVAQAAHGCSAGYGCGWVDGEYGIPLGKWSENTNNFATFGQSKCQTGTWNDCISSLWNEGTSCNAIWWTNSGYGGSGYHNNLGTGTGVLSGGWNDEFSSLKWCQY